MLMATLELEIEDLSVLPALQDVLSRFKGVALKSIKEKSLEELRVSKKSTDLEEYLKRVITLLFQIWNTMQLCDPLLKQV